MKKIITLLLTATMLSTGFTACGKNTEGAAKPYVQPEMKGEITVSVYQSEEWLEMAVQMFEDKYPDMKVKVEPFYTGVDTFVVEGGGASMIDRPAGQEKEDYAAWLNTQLLSGDAGDIVITSEGLAVEKYESMGVFEDLSPYLDSAEEINGEGYYMNIFDAYRTESGALYQFPVSAMASPLFLFDKEIVEETGRLSEIEGKSLTWREALTLAEEMYDASSLPGKGMPEAWSLLGNIFTKEVISSVDYTNGQVKLRDKEMLEIMEAFDEFGYYIPFVWDEYGNNFKVFGLDYAPDTLAASMILDGEYVAAQWMQSDGLVHLSPYFTKDFGINSRSENKALAWEFLKFLLSDEVQTLPSFPWAGINKNGLQARVDAYCDGYEGLKDKSGEMLKLIDSWLSPVNGYRSEDTDLIQVGDAVLASFMDGSLTAEEAVKEAEFRLQQYLSE